MPIGEKEKDLKLKCELCGLLFEEGKDFDGDLESIDETGRCLDCYQEWGDQYPDRV